MIEHIDVDSRTITVHEYSAIYDCDRILFIENHPRWLSCDKKGWWTCKPATRQEEYPAFKSAAKAIDWAIKEYGA